MLSDDLVEDEARLSKSNLFTLILKMMFHALVCLADSTLDKISMFSMNVKHVKIIRWSIFIKDVIHPTRHKIIKNHEMQFRNGSVYTV